MKNVFYLFLLIVTTLQSQTFIPTNIGVFNTPNVSRTDVGDYDNDGDLDIILNGSYNSSNHLEIYNNDGSGNFSLSETTFSEVFSNGQVEFIDYDNDNDLDVFVSGWNASSIYKTILYRNDIGLFSEVSFSFQGNISNSQFGWSDLDNDGDLDVVLSGNNDAIQDYIYVYENLGNDTFMEVNTPLVAYSQGRTLMGDLDNDGDNDIVIGGLNIPPFESSYKIYRNDGNFNFTFITDLDGFMNGDAELRDCNHDGFLDITKTGADFTGMTSTKIYLNNGSFTFSEYGGGISSTINNDMSFVSADYNGNGELDFLLTEQSGSVIYINSGSMSLTPVNAGIPAGAFDDVEIADFDNDHDIDVFVMSESKCEVYNNQIAVPNTIPDSPLNLSSVVTENNVELTWSEAFDTESPNSQLNYNIYVGTSTGMTDVVTPMSDVSNGYRKIVTIGNAQYKKSFHLSNLADGIYYWSVQSIDNQYEGSGFAPEQSFTIVSIEEEEEEEDNLSDEVIIYPNPTNGIVNIETEIQDYEIVIHNTLGQQVLSFEKTNDTILNLTKLESGLYFLLFKDRKEGGRVKVIKILIPRN